MGMVIGNEKPLIVPPKLAEEIGLNEAMFLQQLYYWLHTSPTWIDGRPWVYNSVQEWNDQFPFWSASTLRRAINNLIGAGYVNTADYNEDRQKRTLWYSIDIEELSTIVDVEPFSQIEQMPPIPTRTAEEPEQPPANESEPEPEASAQNDEMPAGAFVQNEKSICSNWANHNKESETTTENKDTHTAREAPKPIGAECTRQELAAKKAKRIMGNNTPDAATANYGSIDAKLHTKLTNEVKRIFGLDAFIKNPGADEMENEMRRRAYELFGIGFGTVDDVKDLRDKWLECVETRGYSNPVPGWNQLYTLAGQVISGTYQEPKKGANHGTNGTQRNTQRRRSGTIPLEEVEQFYPEPDDDAYDIPEEVLARVHALHAGHSG